MIQESLTGTKYNYALRQRTHITKGRDKTCCNGGKKAVALGIYWSTYRYLQRMTHLFWRKRRRRENGIHYEDSYCNPPLSETTSINQMSSRFMHYDFDIADKYSLWSLWCILITNWSVVYRLYCSTGYYDKLANASVVVARICWWNTILYGIF